MAKARVGIKMDKLGVAQILKSQGLLDAAAGAAESLANTAGSGYEVVRDRDRRKSRVIAMVLNTRDGAMGIEAKTGNLARAVTSMTQPWDKSKK